MIYSKGAREQKKGDIRQNIFFLIGSFVLTFHVHPFFSRNFHFISKIVMSDILGLQRL